MAKEKLTPQQELCKAIWEGWDLEQIKEIIPHVNNLNYLDGYGKSPLYLAVEKGHSGVIELLCQSGASPDLNNSNSDTTPRKLAVSKSMDMNLFNVGSSSGAPVVIEPIGIIKIDFYAAFGGEENFKKIFGQGGSIDVSVDATGDSSVSIAGDGIPHTQ